jgi:hypothetical protein
MSAIKTQPFAPQVAAYLWQSFQTQETNEKATIQKTTIVIATKKQPHSKIIYGS